MGAILSISIMYKSNAVGVHAFYSKDILPHSRCNFLAVSSDNVILPMLIWKLNGCIWASRWLLYEGYFHSSLKYS